jgi:hypothetical protein
LSHADPSITKEEWEYLKNSAPVKIQWDPELDLMLQPLLHRATQIGLGRAAVKPYVNQWICQITDVTPLGREIQSPIEYKKLYEAIRALPGEQEYQQSRI